MNVLSAIEHTALRPEHGPAAVRRLCAEARELRFFGVCVAPGHVPLARRELAGTGLAVATVTGFPLGSNATAIKAREAAHAVALGAGEVDMVLNVGCLKEGDHAAVRSDIAAVVRAAGVPVKVILETALLTAEEIVAACLLAGEAGARFVKTSTGFGPGGATVEAVRLMRAAVGDRLGVKASGGIRTLAQARALLAAGADRLGTSHGTAIAMELLGEAGVGPAAGPLPG